MWWRDGLPHTCNESGNVTNKRWMIGRLMLVAVVGLLAFISGVWAAFALWYQLPGGALARAIGSATWSILVIALAACAIRSQGWLPVGIYMLAYALLLLWWVRIAPSHDRVWADDVGCLLAGQIVGDSVTLVNVRDFTWRTPRDYDVHWETCRYDLANLVSADAVLSYWGSPVIAHAMISFGFSNGRHVVFSVEIRKERHQQYSPIGGFFKQYETILVAAEERDIIRVRTNARGEDVYLYPLRMDRATMRELFVSYVNAANRLIEVPAFYHTITSNCTTLVYRMAKRIGPALSWDPRLLLTGYLPGYFYQIGAVDRRVSLDELRRRSRISERARNSTASDDFSAVIRSEPDASKDKSVHRARR
ncbi:MAG: DUF4105 domain-containing protein [Rhodanobacteraceae bacterium]